METAKLNTYKLKRGNDYFELLHFVDFDDEPIDLTTYSAIKQTIRDGVTRTARELTTVSLNNGILIIGSNNNTLQISIPSTETDKWKGGKYYRDILFTIDNKTFTYAEGLVEVSENVTIK